MVSDSVSHVQDILIYVYIYCELVNKHDLLVLIIDGFLIDLLHV